MRIVSFEQGQHQRTGDYLYHYPQVELIASHIFVKYFCFMFIGRDTDYFDVSLISKHLTGFQVAFVKVLFLLSANCCFCTAAKVRVLFGNALVQHNAGGEVLYYV